MKPAMVSSNSQHNKGVNIDPISIKLVSYKNEIQHVTWTEEEVHKMTIMETL